MGIEFQRALRDALENTTNLEVSNRAVISTSTRAPVMAQMVNAKYL